MLIYPITTGKYAMQIIVKPETCQEETCDAVQMPACSLPPRPLDDKQTPPYYHREIF